MAGGDAQRRVVVTLDYVLGKDSAQVAKTAAAQMLAISKNGAKGQAKAVAEGLKQQTTDQKQAAAAQKALIRETERAQKEANRRNIAILKQVEKEAVAAEREKQRAIKETTSAIRKQQQDYEQQMARGTELRERMGEQFAAGLGDVMKFSRGIATLGLVGEKDLEKLLRGLVKIQAAFDIIGGGLQMWVKASKLMRDFTAATEAAAAAQTALALAQGATATTGVGAAVGGVGKVAVGTGGSLLTGATVALVAKFTALAAVVAGAALALKSLKESAEGRVGEKGTVSGAIGGVLHGRIAALIRGMSKAERKEYIDRQFAGAQRERVQEVVEQIETEESFTLKQTRAETAKAKALDLADQAGLAMRQKLEQAKTPQERLGITRESVAAGATGAIDAQISALKTIMQQREQIKSVVDATNKAAIQGLRDQAKMHLALADQIKQSRMSAEERFGAMTAIDQAEIHRLAQKASSTLTAPEIQKVLGAVPEGSQQSERLRGELRGRGQRAGSGRLFGNERMAEEARLRKRGEQDFARAEQASIALQDNRNVTLSIVYDNKGLIADLIPRIEKAITEKDEAFAAELIEAYNKRNPEQLGELKRNQAQREATRIAGLQEVPG